MIKNRLSYSTFQILSGFLLACGVFLNACTHPPKTSENQKHQDQKGLKDGDIIFHTSTSSQSKAIALATNSNYTHMGIIFNYQEKLMVFEAVNPVKITPLTDWIKRGKNSAFVVKRLKNHEGFSALEKMKLKKQGLKHLGKPYDLLFEWSDEKMYCSELVYKIYKEALGVELCPLEQIKDFDLSHPEVQSKIKERYKKPINPQEIIVSPDAIFKSEKLEEVSIRLPL